jgi:hypothetical protein
MQRSIIKNLESFADLREEYEKAELIVKGMKLTMVERCAEVREHLGISFDESYFYDKTTF